MLPVKDKFQYILVILCEAPEICIALIDSFIEYFGTPIRIFCDQDSAFMSQLTQCFFTLLWYLCNQSKPYLSSIFNDWTWYKKFS